MGWARWSCGQNLKWFTNASARYSSRTTVGIGPREAGGFGLVASLAATVGGLAQADSEKLVAAAHQVCPYSNAMRGNIDVGLEVAVV